MKLNKNSLLKMTGGKAKCLLTLKGSEDKKLAETEKDKTRERGQNWKEDLNGSTFLNDKDLLGNPTQLKERFFFSQVSKSEKTASKCHI